MANEQGSRFLRAAIDEAQTGLAEGGVPIGAALVVDGKVVATSRNRRVQFDSATRHAEIDCLENAGRLPAATYMRATLYTTLSPCPMCCGAVLLYRIPRVVIGESTTFLGAESTLRAAGVELVPMDSEPCRELMRQFIAEYPNVWDEDIGLPPRDQ